jgi:hypothetical protein
MKEYTTLHIFITDEVKLRKKKDEEINYMLSELLQEAWTTFQPMLMLVILLL